MDGYPKNPAPESSETGFVMMRGQAGGATAMVLEYPFFSERIEFCLRHKDDVVIQLNPQNLTRFPEPLVHGDILC